MPFIPLWCKLLLHSSDLHAVSFINSHRFCYASTSLQIVLIRPCAVDSTLKSSYRYWLTFSTSQRECHFCPRVLEDEWHCFVVTRSLCVPWRRRSHLLVTPLRQLPVLTNFHNFPTWMSFLPSCSRGWMALFCCYPSPLCSLTTSLSSPRDSTSFLQPQTTDRIASTARSVA